jgi:hypothetical protein
VRPFHHELPTWAMDAGADVCVTSVHKMGSVYRFRTRRAVLTCGLGVWPGWGRIAGCVYSSVVLIMVWVFGRVVLGAWPGVQKRGDHDSAS